MNAVLFLGEVLVLAVFYQWMLRKIVARIQKRSGPGGIHQPFVDFMKALFKEDMTHGQTGLVFRVMPFIAIVITLLSLFLFNLGPANQFEKNSLLLLCGFLIIEPLIVSLIESSSKSPYMFVGGMRHAARTLMAGVPLILSIIAVASAGSSYSISELGTSWNVLKVPLAFVVFLLYGLAENSLLPFDAPEAAQEIVEGWLTEYSGKKTALWKLNSYLKLVLVAFATTALFLGGGSIPVFLLKSSIIVLLFAFIHATSGRWRMDQMENILWKAGTMIAVIQLIILWS